MGSSIDVSAQTIGQDMFLGVSLPLTVISTKKGLLETVEAIIKLYDKYKIPVKVFDDVDTIDYVYLLEMLDRENAYCFSFYAGQINIPIPEKANVKKYVANFMEKNYSEEWDYYE